MRKTGRLSTTPRFARHQSGARGLLAVPGTCSFTVPHDDGYEHDDDTCTTTSRLLIRRLAEEAWCPVRPCRCSPAQRSPGQAQPGMRDAHTRHALSGKMSSSFERLLHATPL